MVDTCAGEFPSTHAVPLRQLRRGERSAAQRQAVGRHPRQRSESHRAGRRVRLLLRARGARASRAGIRDDHDQLESRDRLHGLRHVGQAVLRAAHVRGRARDRPARAARGRDRAARRPDAAQAHAPARGRGRDDPRHVAGLDRHRRRSSPVRQDRARARAGAAAERHGDERRGSARDRERIGYPVLVRPSYVLGGRAMQIVYDDASLAALLRDGGARVRGAAGAHRSVPRGRVRVRRRRDQRRNARRDRRHHAAHRGRRHSLRRFGVRAAAVSRSASRTCRRCASRRSRWPRPSASSG